MFVLKISIELKLKKLWKRVVVSSLLFGFFPVLVLANVCLHPLEMAALYQGKPKTNSLKSRIKKTNTIAEQLAKKQEATEDKIDEELDRLYNSFKDEGFKDKYPEGSQLQGKPLKKAKRSAVNKISSYMESKQNEWDEPGVPWYPTDEDENDVSSYFGSNGQIQERQFCPEYAKDSDQRECTDAIKKLERLHKRLAEIRKKGQEQLDLRDQLEDEQTDREIAILSGEAEEETEAGALCWDCLDELRELGRPTTGQVLGNALSVLVGGAIGYYGYKAGKREARAINDLRLSGGHDPISSAGLSWAGASMGVPFVTNGIYGLSGGNSPFGSFACGPGHASGHAMYGPFGHYGAQAHLQFPGMIPGMTPGMQAGLQFGAAFNPWMMHNPILAQAGLQFPAAFNPFAAQAHLQFPGAIPGMIPGMTPGMQAGLQFGAAFNPFAAQAHLQFPGMIPGMTPGMVPGMNFQTQYQQQQYAQYLQYQQQQMQAQIQARQAWLQNWQSIQQDRMQRQQALITMSQDIMRIRQKMYLVASGGIGGSALGATSNGISVGIGLGHNIGIGQGPIQGSPGPGGTGPDYSTPPTGQDGDMTIIENW